MPQTKKTIKVNTWGEGQGDYVEINEEDFDRTKHTEYLKQKKSVNKKTKKRASK